MTSPMNPPPTIAFVIPAAGRGERAGGGLPKQFRPVLGQSSLRRAALALAGAAHGARIVAPCAAANRAEVEDELRGLGDVLVVEGGATRQESVRRGLEALADAPPDLVLIHDAARPFVAASIVRDLVAALTGGAIDGAAPALPVVDTLKSATPDRLVERTVARDGLWRVQTPQAFRYAAILAAHREAAAADLTDDLAVAERAGLKLALVDGTEENFKITTRDDFRRAEAHLFARLPDIRTGSGFDVHAFDDGDHVTLCGLAIPHARGLSGHSDADVALHALTDALLGAIGAGDIGQHFPPSDPRWKGASSDRFIRHAAGLIAARGGVIAHLDVTVICEAPKVGPHREAMRASLAAMLALDPDRVSVKATTTEKLGFTGRKEGIAALASATVRLP